MLFNLFELFNGVTNENVIDEYRPLNEFMDQVDELGPINYFANDRYGASDKWFQFKLVKTNGEWHAYINRMPSFGNRDDNLHITHRIPEGEKSYVCYDPMPTNLRDMITVTKAWADRELEYITTGTHFEDQNW